MPRSTPPDPQLEQRWRQRLQQWKRSRLSVRDFCRRHQLPEPSFYHWRREIERRDRECPATPATPVLLPVRIIPGTPLELVLPRGLLLRVPIGHDPADVARLVAALEDRP